MKYVARSRSMEGTTLQDGEVLTILCPISVWSTSRDRSSASSETVLKKRTNELGTVHAIVEFEANRKVDVTSYVHYNGAEGYGEASILVIPPFKLRLPEFF